jgi:hypothetical protein
MPLTPHQLLDCLIAIMPDFAEQWASPDNLFRDDDRSFSYCGVFADCSHYVRNNFERLTSGQRTSLADLIEQCMSRPGTEIDTAAATCFLENLVGEPFSLEWKACLSGRAAEFVRRPSGP